MLEKKYVVKDRVDVRDIFELMQELNLSEDFVKKIFDPSGKFDSLEDAVFGWEAGCGHLEVIEKLLDAIGGIWTVTEYYDEGIEDYKYAVMELEKKKKQ